MIVEVNSTNLDHLHLELLDLLKPYPLVPTNQPVSEGVFHVREVVFAQSVVGLATVGAGAGSTHLPLLPTLELQYK